MVIRTNSLDAVVPIELTVVHPFKTEPTTLFFGDIKVGETKTVGLTVTSGDGIDLSNVDVVNQVGEELQLTSDCHTSQITLTAQYSPKQIPNTIISGAVLFIDKCHSNYPPLRVPVVARITN